MRILSISGQNIASLADRFTIDFTAEPLRSAGLFAITGETGAGKSSILDALCLALYGECPRLTVGGSADEVPDAGGEAIRARDPRAVLRRGAAQGWAQVVFQGLDGETYRVDWSTRRARDRVDGRLQAVARTVARVSDGQVLDNQPTLVGQRVQALTGLSYDEFRRTVLLAQGDFDAFLRADTNDRAALLEKVTGTGRYRSISVRIFERTEAAQEVHRTLEQQRAAYPLLSSDESAALSAERADLHEALQNGGAEILRLTGDLDRHRRQTEAQDRRDAAAQALAEAQAASLAVQAERDRLALTDRAEPLRLPWQAAQTTAAAATEAEAAQAAAQRALASADADLGTHREAARQASAAHQAAEADFKDYGPIWTKAAALDTRIETAADELALAETAAGNATGDALAAQIALTDLQQRETDATTRHDDASDRLAALAALAPLAGRWAEADRALAARGLSRQAETLAAAQAVLLDAQARDIATSLAALNADDAQDRRTRDDLTMGIQLLLALVAGLDADRPQDLANRLQGLTGTLASLQSTLRDHTAFRAAAASAAATRSQAETELHQARSEIERQTAAADRAEAARQSLVSPFENAAAAVSEAARHLRLRLVQGQACPVCGATDHPTHSDSALAALAGQLRSSLEAAEQAGAVARQARNVAESRAATTHATHVQAAEAEATALAQSDQAATRWHGLTEAALATGLCPDLPPGPHQAAPLLEAALAATDRRLQAAQATLVQIADLRRDQAQVEQDRSRLTHALDVRTAERARLADQNAETTQQAALARQTATSAARRCAELDATLAPLLAIAGEATASLDTEPGAVAARLSDKVTAYGAAVQDRARTESDLAAIRPAVQTATATVKRAAADLSNRQSEASSRQATLATLRTERAALLGGEPTDSHRTRFNQLRLATETARDAATSARQSAEARRGEAAGQMQAASTRLTASVQGADAGKAALTVAVQASGLAPETLSELFAQPLAELGRMRRSVRSLDDTVTAATSALAARQADLAAASAAGLPDAPPETLAADLAAQEADQRGRMERTGAIASRLAADATSRAALAGLDAAIATAQASLVVWQAVNAAVGSRSGDRFARRAQSITLDVLVDRANHHLAELKPRYRLKRAGGDLALNIVDLDMGGEERSTRSLSGGERFLVSLSLALALSRLGSNGGLAATLFIDEGFGALDAASLDLAIDALEALQSQGRTVGVISHVEAMKDRIPVQVRVNRQGGGRSTVSVEGPGSAPPASALPVA